MKTHKKVWIFLAVCLVVMFVSSLFASEIQSNWNSIKVTDLRSATNAGPWAKDTSVTVKGSVVSGILFVPPTASASNKLPAIVVTHGYLNNRELQLQNAIELSRRGFVVLAIDREGHGNNNNTRNTTAVFGRGLYDAAKYLYNLDYVDKAKIGITGHSMGGLDTSATLMEDSSDVAKLANASSIGAFVGDIGRKDLTPQNGFGLGIISAGLMQGFDTFVGANSNVSVGIVKADDDEFFFGPTSFPNPGNALADGTPAISRQYLNSVFGAKFVGVPTTGKIDIQNGAIYVNGSPVNVTEGTAATSPFRVIYQHNEIHPTNHFSTETAASVSNFFYTAFGTPAGSSYIASTNEVWPVKEFFSCLQLIAFFAMFIPLVELFLCIPFFARLRAKKDEQAMLSLPSLKGGQVHIFYWVTGIAVTLFAGFTIHIFGAMNTGIGTQWFPLTASYPQDTTNWIVMWADAVGLFAIGVTLAVWGLNALVNKIRGKEVALYTKSPFEAAKIEGGIGALAQTLLLAGILIAIAYVFVDFIWGIWTVDPRIWTFDVNAFNVSTLLPTMLRYSVFFGIFFCINSILNQNYRMKNLPEWASIAINAFFNVFGIVLVFIIQYATLKGTGTAWQPDTSMAYINLFPIVPELIIATIFSRVFYKKTGNAWLGGILCALLFTFITCSNTGASFGYIMG